MVEEGFLNEHVTYYTKDVLGSALRVYHGSQTEMKISRYIDSKDILFSDFSFT